MSETILKTKIHKNSIFPDIIGQHLICYMSMLQPHKHYLNINILEVYFGRFFYFEK